MSRSARSRVLVVLLLMLFAGTAAALFSGSLPYLMWDQIVTRYAAHVNSGPQKPENPKTKPQTATSPPPAKSIADQTTAEPEKPKAAPSPELAPDPPVRKDFDVATIDPGGVSVFAGSTAEPNSRVAVLADGVEIGSTRAGADGEWTLVIEKKLATRNPKLSIMTRKEQPDETKPAKNNAPPQSPAGLAAAEQTSAPAHAQGQRRFAKADNLTSVRDIQAGFMRNLEQLVETARASTGDRRTALVVPAAATQQQSTETRPDETYARGPNPDPMPPKPVPLSKANEKVTVLIPVAFVFREPNLTPEGQRAAALLLEYVKLKGFNSVTLTGHADERGSPELNMELSRDRLQTVAQILKGGGYSGELNLVAKGKSEPFQGVDRSRFNQEDLYQLDRRVELLASR